MKLIKAVFTVVLLSVLLSGYSWSADYNLNLTMAGSGLGGVVSSPAGMNCVENCSESHTEYTTVTITATPTSGYSFNGWDGDCIGVSPTCTLTMVAAKDVTANFGDLYTRRYEKVTAYFVATLGRPATSDELETWSQLLDTFNGNVWKCGLVWHLYDNGTEYDLESLTEGMSYTQIVEMTYGNMVGETPHAAVLGFYVNHLKAGTIKVRGLANAIMNDMGLMPRIDGVYTRPSTWSTDLSMFIGDEERRTMLHKVEVARYFTDLITTTQPDTTRTTGADLLAAVSSDRDNVMTTKSMIALISIGGDTNDFDADNDGYTTNQGDCADTNASINPGAMEVCGDGVDQDCSGQDSLCPGTLTALTISGGTLVNESGTLQLTATATRSDGTTSDVTAVANWFENAAAVSSVASGLVIAGSVSSDTNVTISGSYTSGGITVSDTHAVTVKNVPTPVTSGARLTIRMLNSVSNVTGNNPVEGFAFISFSVGTTVITVNVTAIATNAALDFTTAYDAVVVAINAELAVQGYSSVTTAKAAIEPAVFSIPVDAYATGDSAGSYFPITLTNTGPEVLAGIAIELSQLNYDTDMNNSFSAVAPVTF